MGRAYYCRLFRGISAYDDNVILGMDQYTGDQRMDRSN